VASIFFYVLQPTSDSNTDNRDDSLGFAIGFGAANAVFSAIAYFLVEPLEDDEPMEDRPIPVTQMLRRGFEKLVFGRRALLICSLGVGAVMLLVLTLLLRMDESNEAKLPVVMLFIILWTLFYSPGAGCIPFLYSAEVWPNEGRGKSSFLQWLFSAARSLLGKIDPY
jgi:hypothetical protein